MIELPPLPEPEIAPFARADANDSGNGGLFSRDQMRAYGEACARAAIDAAARLFDVNPPERRILLQQIRALATSPSSPSSSQTRS
jgi:hypothetical protein